MTTMDVKVPDVGVEGKVEVIEILVAKGDALEQEAPIVTLETDKATVEVPCPEAGTVAGISVAVGDKVGEGDVLLQLETDAAGSDSTADDKADEADATAEDKAANEADADDDPPESSANSSDDATGSEAQSAEDQEQEITVPDLGGSEQVEVIEILVAEGDTITAEQALIVLESDKATMEIPAPQAGTLQKLSLAVGDKVSEGDVIGSLLVSADAAASQSEHDAQQGGEERETQDQSSQRDSTDAGQAGSANRGADNSRGEVPRASSANGSDGAQLSEAAVNRSAAKVHAGPAVRKLARELGADLAQIKGSGPKSRILKDDVKKYVKSQMSQVQSGAGAGAALPVSKLPDFSKFGEIETESMDKIQRLTATNMTTSWLNVPHVTQFDEADITELEVFRKAQKAAAEQRNVKLTPMPFLLKACAYALQQLPQFNVSLDMEQQRIIRKRYVHIGMAVDTPGGLVVPVIRDVNKKSLWELAEECMDMAAKAKDRKLSPAEMQGGCFTISSLGSIGGTAFTPIVNLPEVAILGVSRSEMKPKYQNGGFEPRLMLPLSLSYDHRAINGADAARFTRLLAELLGDIRQMLL